MEATAGKPIRCRAAVCRKAGEPLVIEEITVAPPMPREVRIKVICTSLCHSDVTFWLMKDPPSIFPRIFGHEAIGVVESVGEDVKEVSEGDVVIPTFFSDCGECEDCRSPKSNLCSKLPFRVENPWMSRYDSSRFRDVNGEVIYHFLSVSSFSEYTAVDIANVTKVDPSIPPNKACLVSCGIATAAEGAIQCGAARIIGVDINPDKFEIGNFFWSESVNSGKCGDKSCQVINEMTGGGADYCFECVGRSSLVEQGWHCRKGWGKTIMVGVDKPGTKLSLNSFDVLHKGKSLVGSLYGGLKPKSDIPILLERYVNKELQLDEFVTHELKFEEIIKAFELLVEGKSLRCVMWVNK
ncbi:hypothetical protein UlMin_033984 [Ulmus minor]